jgi:hypothetical protein
VDGFFSGLLRDIRDFLRPFHIPVPAPGCVRSFLNQQSADWSKNMSINENPPRQGNQPPETAKLGNIQSLIRIMVIAGVLSVAAGAFMLVGAMQGLGPESGISDGWFNIGTGLLLVICSRILTKRRFLVVWVFAATILYSVGYSYAMGRGFNFIIVFVGAYVIWQLFTLRKSGGLV